MSAMPDVPLGRGNLKSSRIAYGCWRIAGDPNVARSSTTAAAAGQRAVIAAYEAGYTLFDLADIYSRGRCETIFGQALKEVSGMRDRIAVATKCGIRFPGDPDEAAPYRYDFTAAHIIRSCEASLERMGIDRIDLYLLHRPDYLGDPVEVARAFTQLQKQGKVREFGVSNFRPSQVVLYQKLCPLPLVVNQVEISLSRLDCLQDGTLDQCLAETITPLAWSPLAGGVLGDSGPIDLKEPDHAHRIHLRAVTDRIASAHNTDRSVIALAWLLQHPSQIVPIIGTTKPERLQQAKRALDLDLTREEWYRLLEAARGERLP